MPVRVKTQRLSFLLLIFAAVAIFFADKADVAFVERLRTHVIDLTAPVLEVVVHPIAAVNRVFDELDHLIRIFDENLRLKAEVDRLRQWQQVARVLERDNAQYRHLLNVAPGPAVSFVSGRVIGDSGGPFVRTLLLNAGAREGVRKGQAVVSAHGLVGRIADVGRRSSRVLLLTDLNSRIPVLLEGSRYRAVLAGNNTDRPLLAFLPAGAQVSPGDRVVTSGHGGLFPPGQPIGVVSSVNDAVARVQPFTDWNRLEYVSVLRYDMPRMDVGAPGP